MFALYETAEAPVVDRPQPRVVPTAHIVPVHGQQLLTVCTIAAADLIAVLIACALIVLGRYWIAKVYDPLFYVRLIPVLVLFPVVFAYAGLYPGVVLNAVEEIR